MQRTTIQKLKRHTLWLSLLAHLLLLLSFTAVFVWTKKDESPQSSPPASISSYLAPTPAPEQPPAPEPIAKAQPEPEPVPQPEPHPQPKETAIDGIEKPAAKPTASKKTMPKAHASRANQPVTFSKDTIPEDITNPRDQEPLHLVGESKIIKPLVKILARALSKHLFYPRVAADFNLRGVVLVGFTLHPEGYVTAAKVVKSSGAGVLDDAARDAVGAMSPVGDVHEYVSSPEFMVVGIIFG